MDAHIGRAARFDHAIVEAIDRWCVADIRYGRDDCLMALAAIVEQVEGVDLGKPYRGRYRSAKGALRVLGRRGVLGAMARGARALGWLRMAPASCQSGALGVIQTEQGPAGVMRYGSMWVGRMDSGLGMFPTFTPAGKPVIERAWGYE